MSSSFGSLDLRYSYVSTLTTYVKVILDIAASRAEVNEVPRVISIATSKVIVSSKAYAYTLLFLGNSIIDGSTFQLGNSDVDIFDIRVFMFNNYIAVTCNGLWVYTYGFGEISYPSPVSVKLKAIGGAIDITNIVRRELYDGRSAIFIDYEASGESALSSIIQQRPVQILPGVDRDLDFTYQVIKDQVDVNYPVEVRIAQAENAQMSSDGLVYYRDVGISLSQLTAKFIGFITRLYRLSELDTGAIEAAGIIQKIGLERRNIISISARFDPRIEIMDEIIIDQVVAGNGREINEDIIVESVTVDIGNGKYASQISGRRNSE